MTVTASDRIDTKPRLQVGAAVEARPRNVDELFYAAEVKAVREEDSGEEVKISYEVEYEDGGREGDLPLDALLYPADQREVFNDGVVRVVDGHASLDEVAVKVSVQKKARLMSFVESLQLVQSAVIIKEPEPLVLDHRTQLFDVDQALACVVPVYLSFDRAGTEEEATQNVDITVIGAGGATLPMALIKKHPGLFTMNVLDNNQNVLNCARDFFGAEAPGLRLLFNDGIRFLQEQEDGSVDILVVDVAAPEATSAAAVELPPAAFRQKESFELYNRKVQQRSGWIAVNVLASKSGLIELLQLARECFRHVYVLATDPNYVFFLSNAAVLHEKVITADHVANAVSEAGYEHDLAHNVLAEVTETEQYAGDKVILGWFDSKRFESLLDEAEII